LQRDYPNIVGFVRTTIKDCPETSAQDALAQLETEIARIVTDKNLMPSVFERRPPDWFMVKEGLEKLEEEGQDYISYEAYEQLDFIKALAPEDRKSNLKLLSMLGTVVSFVDDPRLMDTNVINPQWIMDGVYALINDAEVKDQRKGRLHIQDLKRILPSDKFPQNKHAYLLELMKKFTLCYPALDENDVFYLPDLFEDVEPDYVWDEDNCMRFRFNYDDYSPDIFMTRFIVEMHLDIVENKRWKTGVYIANGRCSAKVYRAYRKNHIHIEINGDKKEARNYLYAIRESFRKLHKPFPNMEIQEEVRYKEKWFDYT